LVPGLRDPAEPARDLHECLAMGDLCRCPEDHAQVFGPQRVSESLVDTGRGNRCAAQDEIDQLKASHLLVARQSCALLLEDVD